MGRRIWLAIWAKKTVIPDSLRVWRSC